MKNRESAYTRETTRATLLVVDEPHTHAGGRVSLCLSHSQSLLLLLPADDDARKGEQWRCSWWPWHPTQRYSNAQEKKQNGRTRQRERKNDRLLFFCILSLFSLSFPFSLLLFFLCSIWMKWRCW
jgi:hypothetical protein